MSILVLNNKYLLMYLILYFFYFTVYCAYDDMSTFQRNGLDKADEMLNLFSLKEKKEAEVKSGGGGKKKTSAAQLRITKVTSLPLSSLPPHPLYSQDISEMELPKTCKTDFPDPDDLLVFKLTIYPDEVHFRDYC